ncbi:MAG: VPLPA-CTERM sorting domain-containing protein [Gammaproteobacteria bacterium]|nr:VPLPA-CTERM sorting domain-containing protein [Gammaproteobacteria bacterium]
MVDGTPNLDSFLVGPGTISIEYTYTPAVVPVPAAVWMFISAVVGLGIVKRRAA